MRAIFTVGVLDCFMDHDIWVAFTVGVSGGAGDGISCASRRSGGAGFGWVGGGGGGVGGWVGVCV